MARCVTCGSSAPDGSYGLLGQQQCARCRDKSTGLVFGLQQGSIGTAAALIGPDDVDRVDRRDRKGGGILAWIRRSLRGSR